MNKKILTAVVSAALVAGPMVASAAGPTVAGVIHMSLDRFNSEAGLSEGRVSSNFSYFEIKGDDELGGGLKSVYQVRIPFRADDGTAFGGASATSTTGSLYDTFLGVSSSSLGTLRFGRMDSPVKDLAAVVNMYGARVGDARNVIGQVGSTQSATTEFNNRYSNSVRYDSPSFGGVTAAAQLVTIETVSPSPRDIVSANVRWASGPLVLGLGHEMRNTSGNEDETATRFVGSFQFGAFTVAALYEMLKDLTGVAGQDRDSMGASFAWKLGNNVLRAQYVETDKLKNSSTDNGGSLIAAGLDHNLSKNTMAYIVYALADNDPGATFKTAGAGAHAESLAAIAGQEQKALSVGMQIKF